MAVQSPHCNTAPPPPRRSKAWEVAGRGAQEASDSRKSMQAKGTDCAKASKQPGFFMTVSSPAG